MCAETLLRNAGRAAPSGRCPICGQTRLRLIGRKNELTLWHCEECSVVFTDPQPRAVVRKKYLEEYDLAAHFGDLQPRKRVLFRRQLQRLPSPTVGRDRICDVGCAGGQFLELAQESGWKPFGVEMNPPAVARAEKVGVEVFLGALEELDGLPWETFDLVTCWDTLEHSPEPVVFSAKLAQLLKRGGLLALTTLNWRSLARKVFGMRWSMIVEDHFTYWDRHSLTSLFRAQGLEVCEVETFGLGRDFVSALDRRGSSMGGVRSRTSSADASSANWDVHPLVLRVESVLNRAFASLGGGVGIRVILRRP
jgi:2-polyprenyl-3-methyl-5-hydroxy-6-metoxy-1,4-benzoquinol methylase